VDRTVALLLAVAAGAVVASQAPTNGALGESIGNLRAALVNFAVGSAVLLLVVLLIGGGLGGLFDDPTRWHYLGGLAGAFFVSIAVVTVAPLGVTLQTAAILLGQFAMSMVIDRYGWFGIEAQPIGAQHLLGVGLMAAGLVVLARA
jgi:transporter family-2 protein